MASSPSGNEQLTVGLALFFFSLYALTSYTFSRSELCASDWIGLMKRQIKVILMCL